MSELAQIRPRGMGELIDASFRFYRAHAGNLLVVSALLLVPRTLIQAMVPDSARFAVGIAGNWMYFVVHGTIAVYVGAAVEREQRLSAGDVFRTLNGRWVKVITTSMLSWVMVTLGIVFLVVPAIIALSWTAVAVPIAAIEGLSSAPAVERSRALARGRMKHVLGTLALVWLIAFSLFVGGAFSIEVLSGVIGIPERIYEMVVALLWVPLYPLASVTLTLLYYDLRVRSEGADVSAMIDALPGTQPVILPEA
jgi:hypothetical protein